MILLFQLFFIAIIIASSFFGLSALAFVFIASLLFTFANVFTFQLMFLQISVIGIAFLIGLCIVFVKFISSSPVTTICGILIIIFIAFINSISNIKFDPFYSFKELPIEEQRDIIQVLILLFILILVYCRKFIFSFCKSIISNLSNIFRKKSCINFTQMIFYFLGKLTYVISIYLTYLPIIYFVINYFPKNILTLFILVSIFFYFHTYTCSVLLIKYDSIIYMILIIINIILIIFWNYTGYTNSLICLVIAILYKICTYLLSYCNSFLKKGVSK